MLADRLRLFLGLCIAFALPSCVTPGPIARLTPRSPDFSWVSGRGVMVRQNGDVRLACAFERHHDELLGFHLEIANDTTAAFEIAPDDVVFMTCAGPQTCAPARRVVDPERVILDLEVARSREKAAKESEEIQSGILALVSLTGSVAALGSGKPRTAAAFADDAVTISARADARSAARARNIAMVDASRIDWEASALRRTTLFPGKGIAGRVFTPFDPKATIVWVGVTVGRRKTWFPFDQALVDAGPARP